MVSKKESAFPGVLLLGSMLVFGGVAVGTVFPGPSWNASAFQDFSLTGQFLWTCFTIGPTLWVVIVSPFLGWDLT